MIRISFRYAGSWSAVGSTCLHIADPAQPTMNFGWLTPASTPTELRRVVLHEFGHALGLVHEHQSPAGGIDWDEEVVARDLSGPPHNWSPEDIRRNMFEPVAKRESNYTALDRRSIMMYPIPKRWTRNGVSAGLNSTLSPTDRAFIRQAYR
jgi:serralysin